MEQGFKNTSYICWILNWLTVDPDKYCLRIRQCEEKSTTMQPMVGGKLSKSEESYLNTHETRASESVQLTEKWGKLKKKVSKVRKVRNSK